MIAATNLSMRFGSKILFKNATFQLNPGQHYGLVGANGTGKSTLMRILTGELTSETGDITIPSLVQVGTLKQNQYLYEAVPILDVVLMGKQKLWEALHQKEILLSHEHFSEEACHKLESLEKTIAQHDGYSAPSAAAKLLEGLGIYEEVHKKPMSILSGGYKLRVLLAQVLFSRPDILLLDEPTNHLDIFSIRWLENYLKDFPGTLLISSHDWDFLNGVCNHILDLDYQTLKIYPGNYEDFLAQKAADRELKLINLSKQEKKKEDLQEFIDRFRAKSSKARQAQSKVKLVEKLEVEMAQLDLTPSSRMYPKIHFEQYRPSGAIAVAVKNIHKSYGEKNVLQDISFEIERGDRVAILGANGIGKSTLLEILTGNAPATQGTYQWGHAAQVAYFPQDHQREVFGQDTLLDWLRLHDRDIPEQKARDMLGRVLFSGDDAKKTINILSGGETARLVLAKMMLAQHNVLIFDEPTNHLDMEATEALLEALEEYPGTILFVSHNRHFISQIATRIIEITREGLKDFKCSYAEYLAQRDIDLLSTKNNARRPDLIPKDKEQQKNKYEEQKAQRNVRAQIEKKIASLEKKCSDLEVKIKAIDHKLGEEGFYQKTSKDELHKILEQKTLLEQELNASYVEWEEKHKEISDKAT